MRVKGRHECIWQRKLFTGILIAAMETIHILNKCVGAKIETHFGKRKIEQQELHLTNFGNSTDL